VIGSGRYIVFEGVEGCGKSTQARLLAEQLGAVLTRETGGTPIGERIRTILHDPANVELAPTAEALLIAADRAQHLAQVVEPALAAGRHVVSDRSVYSSLAYQGYGRGLPLDTVRAVNEWALAGHWPDLAILLDVSAHHVRSRMSGRELDRFEREDTSFFDRVTAGFRAMAAAEPHRWIVIDGNHGIDVVAHAVVTAVRLRLTAPAHDR
jgi:dTMP kinase